MATARETLEAALPGLRGAQPDDGRHRRRDGRHRARARARARRGRDRRGRARRVVVAADPRPRRRRRAGGRRRDGGGRRRAVPRARDGYVHPSHRGRGIGTALVAWWTALAGEHGLPVAGQTVCDDDTAAVALLRGLGCTDGHTSWILDYPLDRRPARPAAPAARHRPAAAASRARSARCFTSSTTPSRTGRIASRRIYEDWAATTVAFAALGAVAWAWSRSTAPSWSAAATAAGVPGGGLDRADRRRRALPRPRHRPGAAAARVRRVLGPRAGGSACRPTRAPAPSTCTCTSG